MTTIYTVTGTLRDNRVVTLDESIPLYSQRVRLTVEPLPQEIADGQRFLNTLHAIRDKLAATGYQLRTKEEIDAQIRAERELGELTPHAPGARPSHRTAGALRVQDTGRHSSGSRHCDPLRHVPDQR